MAASSSCCPFGELLHKLSTETEWTSADIVKLQELHFESDCPHVPLAHIKLTRMRHGQTCTVTPLFIAIEQGNLEMVKLIHQTWGVDLVHATLNETYYVKPPHSMYLLTFYKVTPLFAAAYFKHYDVVRYLVEQKVNISVGASSIDLGNNADDDGYYVELTPLHAACLLLERDNVESVQLAIIRFLVKSGADPNGLSSGTHFLPLIFRLFSVYAKYEDREIQDNKWINPNVIVLLAELGMNVTPRYFSFGRTVLHTLAGSFIIKDVEDSVRLLLQKGGDLQARDDHGFTPIMLAAAGNNRVPNITFLNHLLDREDIPTKEKIDALEVAAAVLLGYETNADRFDIAFDYLARARQLRIHGSFPLTQQPPSNNRAMEWITSPTNEQDIQHHPDQFPMQSFLIRLRIFSAISWQAVYRHLWPYLSLYFFNKLDEEELADQLLDSSLKMLETILLFSLQDEGIWIATVNVVRTLTDTLEHLRRENNPLYNVDTVKNSLELAASTYQIILDHNNHHPIADSNFCYFIAFVYLISMTAELEPTDIEIVRKIVSQNGHCLECGMTLFHAACYVTLSADNLLAVIKFLLQHGADPHVVCKVGKGALHYLASGETNRWDIEATAHLLLDMGLHLDHVDYGRKTAADYYKEEHPEANVLPDWLQEGVPKLACLSARVSQGNKIKYEKEELPATLQPFLKKH